MPDTSGILAIDLFSGAGGFSEGLASVGIEVGLAQELHPQPALTHAFNHPSTPVMVGDIRKIDISEMERLIKAHFPDRAIDVVVGGPPCQGFSTAGKKSEVDPRNSLFFNFYKVVERFAPRIFVLENVPGFKTMYGGQAYAAAVKLFESLGYELEDRILNACDYGVPQRRHRFVMVGVRSGTSFSWPEQTHFSPERNKSPEPFGSNLVEPVTVQEALCDLDYLEPGFEGHAHHSTAQGDYQAARRGSCGTLFNHLATRHRQRAIAMFSYIPEGGTINQVPDHVKSAKRTMARLDRRQISNSVLALPDDLIHYKQPRIPTVREMARLQSFDDDYVFIGKRTSGFVERKIDVPQYTQVGNAVPPLLARAIGREVVKSLGGRVRDLRDRDTRRIRHKWVRGSSGYKGYALGEEARVLLYNMSGDLMPLPINQDLPRVIDRPALIEWKVDAARNMNRKGAAPGIKHPVKTKRREPKPQTFQTLP